MGLSNLWLKFTQKLMDAMMHNMMNDRSVSLDDWKELQSDYKATYGKDYLPPHAIKENTK